MDIAVVVYMVEVSVVDSECRAVVEGHGGSWSCGKGGRGLREALRLDVDISYRTKSTA